MAKAKRRGRPKQKDTVKVSALLYPDQKRRLDFLHDHLPGNPPLVGLIRDAVADYLDMQFNESVRKTYKEAQKKDLRIIG